MSARGALHHQQLLGVPMQALSQQEIDWVNAYHQEVWHKVSPRVQDQQLLEWVKANTQPL